MTEGEKIILLRTHAVELHKLAADVAELQRHMKEVKEILKSPIRMAVHAAKNQNNVADAHD